MSPHHAVEFCLVLVLVRSASCLVFVCRIRVSFDRCTYAPACIRSACMYIRVYMYICMRGAFLWWGRGRVRVSQPVAYFCWLERIAYWVLVFSVTFNLVYSLYRTTRKITLPSRRMFMLIFSTQTGSNAGFVHPDRFPCWFCPSRRISMLILSIQTDSHAGFVYPDGFSCWFCPSRRVSMLIFFTRGGGVDSERGFSYDEIFPRYFLDISGTTFIFVCMIPPFVALGEHRVVGKSPKEACRLKCYTILSQRWLTWADQ